MELLVFYILFLEFGISAGQGTRRRLEDCSTRYRNYAVDHIGVHFGSAGTPTKIKEFAHMAAIGWTQMNGDISFNCGGSLITETFVLTAAHCTSRDSIAPDVLRLGDINLYNKEDDKYAQEFKIAQIIRHPEYKFSARYNDIALMKLNGTAIVTGPVCPACLYTGKAIPFDQLEATGWGDTGFSQSKSDVLLKFRLAPTPLNNCSIFYPPAHNLRNGLDEQQMICAFDTLMDTCSGDSGGPLGAKLTAGNLEVPYIIGITSFGLACGFGTPGVYTKVSTYIPWIESVVDVDFNLKACALRLLKHRESIDFSINPPIRINWNYKYNNHVAIQWTATTEDEVESCLGTLISENYVITSATCLQSKPKPDIAELGNLDYIQRIPIKGVTIHPNFGDNLIDDNIALVQLEPSVKLSKETYPACIWTEKEISQLWLKVVANGPENFYILENENETKPIDIDLYLNLDGTNQCMQNNISSKKFCFGKTYFAVPDICNIRNGSPIEMSIPISEKVYNFIFGIYSAGDDCGYGKAATFTRLSEYVNWIESIIFNENDAPEPVPIVPLEDNDQITFIDDSNPNCTRKDGSIGTCKQRFRCPPQQLAQSLAYLQSIEYCENGMVCCVN